MPNNKKPAFRFSKGGRVLEYWSAEDTLIWTLAFEDIVLMAEYKTDEEPDLDDYFLVFVTFEDGATFYATATFYSEGRE